MNEEKIRTCIVLRNINTKDIIRSCLKRKFVPRLYQESYKKKEVASSDFTGYHSPFHVIESRSSKSKKDKRTNTLAKSPEGNRVKMNIVEKERSDEEQMVKKESVIIDDTEIKLITITQDKKKTPCCYCRRRIPSTIKVPIKIIFNKDVSLADRINGAKPSMRIVGTLAFCSYDCCLTHIINETNKESSKIDPLYREALTNLHFLHHMDNQEQDMKILPHWTLLKRNGGTLSDEEFFSGKELLPSGAIWNDVQSVEKIFLST